MKLIIDIDESDYERIKDLVANDTRYTTATTVGTAYQVIANGLPYERSQGDLISRDALIDVLKTELASVPQPDTDADYYVGVHQGLKLAETLINNAPAVYDNPYSDGREDGYIEGYEQAKLEMVGPPQYWLWDDAGHFYCPQCKKYPDYQIRLMDFCPNCGCDLRGEN